MSRQCEAILVAILMLVLPGCRAQSQVSADLGAAGPASDEGPGGDGAPPPDAARGDGAVVDLAPSSLCTLVLAPIERILSDRQCAADADCACVCYKDLRCFKAVGALESLFAEAALFPGCLSPNDFMCTVIQQYLVPVCNSGRCELGPGRVN